MQSIPVIRQLLNQIPRRTFQSVVDRYEGDRWVKSFTCWQQLVAMVFAQLSGQTSLRDTVAAFNAHPMRHYHLGTRSLARSTLADANAKRDPAIFEDLLQVLVARLAGAAGRRARVAVRLLDSTIITLSAKLHDWAAFRANNSGVKVSMVYDPEAQCPTFFEVTKARITDQTLARNIPIEPGATYVFDRAYVDAAFWTKLDAEGCRFVTRAKKNYLLEVVHQRTCPAPNLRADDIVRLAGKRGEKYPGLLRRITYRCEETGRELVFLTNDLDAEAEEIAALYKQRWQIELFFKWIKQNLKLKRFLANSPDAVRIQIATALIAFVLLKLLAQARSLTAPLKRICAVARNNLFNLRAIDSLLSPPQPKPPDSPPPQLQLNFPGQ